MQQVKQLEKIISGEDGEEDNEAKSGDEDQDAEEPSSNKE